MMKKSIFFLVSILLFSQMLFAQESNYGYNNQKNIIRIAPITIFYGGTGASVSYERFIDKENKISVNIPIGIGIRNYYINSYYSNYNKETNYSILFAPGIKLYPRGQHRTVNFSIGGSLFGTYGSDDGFKQEKFYSNPNNLNPNPVIVYSNDVEMRIGSILTTSLTINILPKLNIGLDGFVGASLYNKINSSLESLKINNGVKPMGGASVSIGYRF